MADHNTASESNLKVYESNTNLLAYDLGNSDFKGAPKGLEAKGGGKDYNSSKHQIVFEFKIEGMTCVSCSSAIERGLKSEFKEKGLAMDLEKGTYDVNVVLLMHKMRIVFEKDKAMECNVTSEKIIEEIEDLGFRAKLIKKHELGEEENDNITALSPRSMRSLIKVSTFAIRGMTCSACSGAIEKHFTTSVHGVLSINVSVK